MKITSTKIEGILIIEPKVFNDERGFFLESWNQKKFNKEVGKDINFVQDNHSHSTKGVLRGLHYQLHKTQSKLVRVVTGTVLDVAVDIRKTSKTFGQHVAIELSAENNKQLWIPAGCAHGFMVISDFADFLYKTTDYYQPEDEHCIQCYDPDLNIDWNMNSTIQPILSEKDKKGTSFKYAEHYQ
jgi:dTDP-4-dehydrorhamnose 3,5-epimerase